MTRLLWAPGPMELVIIGVLLLLFFGHRLPSMMRSLGKGFTEFKRGLKEPAEDDEQESSGGGSGSGGP